jgi:hypothetical protein
MALEKWRIEVSLQITKKSWEENKKNAQINTILD